MKELNVTFIGAGNMAEALVAGLLCHGHLAANITLTDVNNDRLQALSKKFQVHVEQDNTKAIANANVVVLAVKPQHVHTALAGLRELPDAVTLISIAAGKSIETLQESLPRNGVAWVRVMPNTPALLGAGMSVLFSTADVIHRDRATYVFASSGETAWVDKENMMNAVTAISGSGPAYFFLLAELMQGAGETLGLSTALASKLTVQTALGAGKMLKESGRSAAVLREQVSSPGGTTLAALDCMFEKGIADAVRSGVRAADRRSRELG